MSAAPGRQLGLALAACASLACASPWGGHSAVPEMLANEANAVLWVRSAAENRSLCEQIFLQARTQLDAALALGNRFTAAVEQGGDYLDLPPAVILDIDEVVLDTSPFQARRLVEGNHFRIEEWKEWVNEASAPALPGALEFVQYAHSRNVEIFYITNREADVEEPTRRNLERLGFPVAGDGGNILSKREQPDWGSNKTTRRAAVAARHRVVMLVGDDLNDFVSGSRASPEERIALAARYHEWWGTRWIMLPNAMYGDWEKSLWDFDTSLSQRERFDRKMEALEAVQ